MSNLTTLGDAQWHKSLYEIYLEVTTVLSKSCSALGQNACSMSLSIITELPFEKLHVHLYKAVEPIMRWYFRNLIKSLDLSYGLTLNPRISAFFLLHCTVIRSCDWNSNLVLIYQPITAQLWNLNCHVIGWKMSRKLELYRRTEKE